MVSALGSDPQGQLKTGDACNVFLLNPAPADWCITKTVTLYTSSLANIGYLYLSDILSIWGSKWIPHFLLLNALSISLLICISKFPVLCH